MSVLHKCRVFIIALSIIFGAVVAIRPVFADANSCSDDTLSEEVKTAAGCYDTISDRGNNQVPIIVQNILYVVISISGLVAAAFVVVGSFKYITSNGDVSKVESGKKTIIYALIGIGISVLAFAIVNFTIDAIMKSEGTNSDTSGSDSTTNSALYRSFIKLAGTSTQLTEGETLKINAEANRDVTLTWSSDNPDIATVDQNGKITARKDGTTTITIKGSDGSTATMKVTVSKPVAAASVTITPSSVTLAKGKTTTLKATVSPSNATDKTVTWSSSNQKIATVNKSGLVKAMKEGTVKITAKTSNGKKKTITVTVTSDTKAIAITQELLNDLKYYHQNNYIQARSSCNTDGSLGNHSCGISAYLAGAYALTGKKIDYIGFVQDNCGAFFNGDIARFEYVLYSNDKYHRENYERKYGVKVRHLTGKGANPEQSWNKIVEELKKGHVVINYVTNPPSMLAGNEHFVTSLSYRDKNGGEIYIWNPNNDSKRNKGNCDTGGCWYSKSEYLQNALGGSEAFSYVMSKV